MFTWGTVHDVWAAGRRGQYRTRDVAFGEAPRYVLWFTAVTGMRPLDEKWTVIGEYPTLRDAMDAAELHDLKDSNGDIRVGLIHEGERAAWVRRYCEPGDQVTATWNRDNGVRRDMASTWLDVEAVEEFSLQVAVTSAETRRIRSRAVERIRKAAR